MEHDKYFQSNFRTRVYLDAVRELMLDRGLKMLLRLAKLEDWLEQLPPYDDALAVDFADFAALNEALILAYGPSGGGGVSLRAGRMMFRTMLERFGAEVGLDAASLYAETAPARIRKLLPGVVSGWQLQSDSRITLEEVDAAFIITVVPCPECWGRRETSHTVCYATIGFLQEAVEWAGLGDIYMTVQKACAACVWDHGVCTFVISLLE